MTEIHYHIVEHDGGWAYKLGDVYSETFRTKDEAHTAAEIAAKEQHRGGEGRDDPVPGRARPLEDRDVTRRRSARRGRGGLSPPNRSGLERGQAIARLLSAIVFIPFGILHIVGAPKFLPIMPPMIPFPTAVVIFTGLAEIAGGIGILLAALPQGGGDRARALRDRRLSGQRLPGRCGTSACRRCPTAGGTTGRGSPFSRSLSGGRCSAAASSTGRSGARKAELYCPRGAGCRTHAGTSSRGRASWRDARRAGLVDDPAKFFWAGDALHDARRRRRRHQAPH